MKHRRLVYLYALTLCLSFIDASFAIDEEDPGISHSHAIMTPSKLTQKELEEIKNQEDLANLENDFVMVSEEEISPPIQPQNPKLQEIDEEVKGLITQGGATVVSGAFGYFASNFILQSGLTYLGYKIVVKVLPPVLDYYDISVPSRYAYPVYQAREYVLQKGSDGLQSLYNIAPSLTDVMNKLVPLPPPEELEMTEY